MGSRDSSRAPNLGGALLDTTVGDATIGPLIRGRSDDHVALLSRDTAGDSVKDRSGAVGSPRCQMSGRGAGGDRDVRVGVFGAGGGHGEPFVSRFATPQGLPIGSVLGTSADQNLKNIVWAALATSIHRAHPRWFSS